MPPPRLCPPPGSAADLDALRAGSDLVALGNLSSETAVQTGNSFLQTSVRTIKRTLEDRHFAKRLKVTVITNCPADHAIYPAGTYLMFLSKEGSSYSVSGGFMGALPVESNCGNAVPTQAAGDKARTPRTPTGPRQRFWRTPSPRGSVSVPGPPEQVGSHHLEQSLPPRE